MEGFQEVWGNKGTWLIHLRETLYPRESLIMKPMHKTQTCVKKKKEKNIIN